MTEDIIAIVGTFTTIITLALGIPLVRAYARRKDKELPKEMLQLEQRLTQMTTAIESMSIEIERISENQRFLTKLLSERAPAKALPADRP